MCKLFKDGHKVIPTVDSLEKVKELPKVEEYVLKDNDSFGSGIGQKIVKSNELRKEYKQGQVIQPKLTFKAEVQCYFIGDRLMYVYEYIPSKYPNYPIPNLITLNENERKLANDFATLTNLSVGFQRIDFLRLEDDSLILLEIEDNSPHMNLEELSENYRDIVLEEYKKNLYKYLEN